MKKEKKTIKNITPKKNKKGYKKNLPIVAIVVAAIVVGFISFFVIKPSVNKMIASMQETKPVDLFDFDTNYKDKKVVVAYFSATGNTKIVAEKIANIFKCDAVAIEPEEPYSEFDLTSQDPSTRPMRESAYDPFNPPEEPEEDEEVEVIESDIKPITKLPEIKKLSFNRYDTIILGYPIWYGDAPRVMYTFVSETNLKNKTIIPFCTSDSNEIEPSDSNLMNFASDDANFMVGKRFTPDMSEEEIKEFFIQIGVDINIY